MLRRRHPTRFLYLGDVYWRGTAAEFATNYDRPLGPLAAVTAPTPGNHEWPNHAVGYDPYWTAKHGVAPPAYYSFRVAGWQFLSLNSQITHGAASAQVRWLSHKVSSPGTCRIAFWHRPRWSAGTDHGNAPDMQPVWDALAGHAVLALSGHEHDMQQLRRRAGIVQLVAGSGGYHELYRLDRSRKDLRWGNEKRYGALRIRLQRGRADFAFVAVGGKVLHTGHVTCTPL
jgi:hypothetical protein